MNITRFAAIALVALIATPAFAGGAKKGGVDIKGSVGQLGIIENNQNIASGKGAEATTRVAGVTGKVKIGKDLIQVGYIKDNYNYAYGEEAEACTEVATIGSYDSACAD